MRLVTYSYRGETRIGALIAKDAQNYILDLNRANPSLPTDMIEFLQAGRTAIAAAQAAITAGWCRKRRRCSARRCRGRAKSSALATTIAIIPRRLARIQTSRNTPIFLRNTPTS